jgi:predicted RNA-binding Zn-ribbon protein involved in translation (DUF1610 family)
MVSGRVEELRDVIRHLHGVESKHIDSVPVKETFQGKTVWEGFVEVFELHGHPKASKVYAWAHDTDDPKQPRRHVTVLHVHPVTSPLLAVRAVIFGLMYNPPVKAPMQFCMSCGAKTETVANFCPNCGATLVAIQSQPTRSEPKSFQTKAASIRAGYFTVAAVLVAALVILIVLAIRQRARVGPPRQITSTSAPSVESVATGTVQSSEQKQGGARSTAETQRAPKTSAKSPNRSPMLTNDFREAAMLSKLAIVQLEDKVLGDDDAVFDFYHEQAEKGMTVASARARSDADDRVLTLLYGLESIVLKMRTIELLQRLSPSEGFPASKYLALHNQYMGCGDHIENALSGRQEANDSSCADSSGSRDKQ